MNVQKNRNLPPIIIKSNEDPWALIMEYVNKNKRSFLAPQDYQHILENFSILQHKKSSKTFTSTEQSASLNLSDFKNSSPEARGQSFNLPRPHPVQFNPLSPDLPTLEEISQYGRSKTDKILKKVKFQILEEDSPPAHIHHYRPKRKEQTFFPMHNGLFAPINLPKLKSLKDASQIPNRSNNKKRSKSTFKTQIHGISPLKLSFLDSKYAKIKPKSQTRAKLSKSLDLGWKTEGLEALVLERAPASPEQSRTWGTLSEEEEEEGVEREEEEEDESELKLEEMIFMEGISDRQVLDLVFELFAEIEGFRFGKVPFTRYRRKSVDFYDGDGGERKLPGMKIKSLLTENLYLPDEYLRKQWILKHKGKSEIPKFPWFLRKKDLSLKIKIFREHILKTLCRKTIFLPEDPEDQLNLTKRQRRKRKKRRKQIKRDPEQMKKLLEEIMDIVDKKKAKQFLEIMLNNNLYLYRTIEDAALKSRSSRKSIQRKSKSGTQIFLSHRKHTALLASLHKKNSLDSEAGQIYTEESLRKIVKENDKKSLGYVHNIRKAIFYLKEDADPVEVKQWYANLKDISKDPNIGNLEEKQKYPKYEDYRWDLGLCIKLKDLYLDAQNAQRFKELTIQEEKEIIEKLENLTSCKEMDKLVEFKPAENNKKRLQMLLKQKRPLLRLLTLTTQNKDLEIRQNLKQRSLTSLVNKKSSKKKNFLIRAGYKSERNRVLTNLEKYGKLRLITTQASERGDVANSPRTMRTKNSSMKRSYSSKFSKSKMSKKISKLHLKQFYSKKPLYKKKRKNLYSKATQQVQALNGLKSLIK